MKTKKHAPEAAKVASLDFAGLNHGSVNLNRFLASLPANVVTSLAPHLKLIPLIVGTVLHESNSAQTHVYFPTTATLSLVGQTRDGRSTAVATVGNDGLAGISAFLGSDRSTIETVVQGAGFAYRLSSAIARAESRASEALHQLALLYAQALVTEIAQTAICNRLHSTEQQLCRWLLLTTYHSTADTVLVTQRAIANTLGTRREAIAEAASRLRTASLIKCGRGFVRVVERRKLENHCCECYGVAKNEFDRLLPYRMSLSLDTRMDDSQHSNHSSGTHRESSGSAPRHNISC